MLGLDLWSLARRGELGGVTPSPDYDPAAAALFTRMNVQPDSTRKALINTTILAIKAEPGAWEGLDALYVMAAHESQASRLNWKQALYDLTAVDGPVFTVDRGWVMNGVTPCYLDTGFNPSVQAPLGSQFQQNSAHLAVWNRSAGNLANSNEAGTTAGTVSGGSIRIAAATTSGAPGVRLNQGSTRISATVPASAVGHKLGNRSASNAIQIYSDGVHIDTNSTASNALDNDTIRVLRGSTVFSPRELAAVHFGGSLTGAQVAAIYNALAGYMTSVGA